MPKEGCGAEFESDAVRNVMVNCLTGSDGEREKAFLLSHLRTCQTCRATLAEWGENIRQLLAGADH